MTRPRWHTVASSGGYSHYTLSHSPTYYSPSLSHACRKADALSDLGCFAFLTLILSVLVLLLDVLPNMAQYLYYSWALWPVAPMLVWYSLNLLLVVNANLDLTVCTTFGMALHAVWTLIVLGLYLYLSFLALFCEWNGHQKRLLTYPDAVCKSGVPFQQFVNNVVPRAPFDPHSVTDPFYELRHGFAVFVVTATTLVCMVCVVLTVWSGLIIAFAYKDCTPRRDDSVDISQSVAMEVASLYRSQGSAWPPTTLISNNNMVLYADECEPPPYAEQ